jgi:hypothetical protein
MNSDAESVDCSFRISPAGMRNQSVPLAVSFPRGNEELSRGVARKHIVLKHDPKAWEEGFQAGESNIRIPSRCPYPAGTTQAWSWHSGHVEGDAKRQGYSYSRGALSKGPPSRGPVIV